MERERKEKMTDIFHMFPWMTLQEPGGFDDWNIWTLYSDKVGSEGDDIPKSWWNKYQFHIQTTRRKIWNMIPYFQPFCGRFRWQQDEGCASSVVLLSSTSPSETFIGVQLVLVGW